MRVAGKFVLFDMIKHTFLVCIAFMWHACNIPEEKTVPVMDDLQWLTGQWIGSPGEMRFHEVWERKHDTLMDGSGFARQGDSVVFSEMLSIARILDTLYYIARVGNQNNGEAVRFRIVTADSSGFVSVNPEHDFPKRIEYRHSGRYPNDSLTAIISGPGSGNETQTSEFRFTRNHEKD